MPSSATSRPPCGPRSLPFRVAPRAPDDPAVATCQKQLATATTQRETVFNGETLRGVLLTSYGFSVPGDKAAQAATVIFMGALLLVALSIAGFVHALATPKNETFSRVTRRAPAIPGQCPTGARELP